MSSLKVAFVKHPVSTEQKQALLKKFDKVVDAKFAGKDDKVLDADGKAYKAEVKKDGE